MSHDIKHWRLAVWSLGVATLSLVSVIGVIWWCRCRPIIIPNPIPVEAKANLILKDETVAAWMTNNNYFVLAEEAAAAAAEGREAEDLAFWTGVLFQLGSYDGSEIIYRGVELYREGVKIKTYSETEFTWMNIVSLPEGVSSLSANDLPMETDHAYYLYPSGKPGSNACEEFDACAVDACDTDASFSASGCLRLQKYHSDMTVDGIITYWQGDEGFSFAAVQGGDDPATDPSITGAHPGAGNNGLNNEQTFTFNNDFIIEVYKDNAFTMEHVEDLVAEPDVYKGVDQIKVIYEELGGPGGGSKHDPAWPPGQG